MVGGGLLMDADLGALLTSVGGVDDLPSGAVAAQRAALAASAARLWSPSLGVRACTRARVHACTTARETA